MKKVFKHTEESKRKIGLAHLGKSSWNKGIPCSEETKRKMSLAHMGNTTWLGKHHTEESKRKIGLAHLGKSSWNKGIPCSEETKRKLRLVKKGQIAWNKGIPCSEEEKKRLRLMRRKTIFPIKDTKIEVKIQNFLKDLGIKFVTHQYINIEHGYQCDVFIPDRNIIIEADGNYWHKFPDSRNIDYIRTQELIEDDYKVLRLWGSEINEMNIEEFNFIIEGIFTV